MLPTTTTLSPRKCHSRLRQKGDRKSQADLSKAQIVPLGVDELEPLTGHSLAMRLDLAARFLQPVLLDANDDALKGRSLVEQETRTLIVRC